MLLGTHRGPERSQRASSWEESTVRHHRRIIQWTLVSQLFLGIAAAEAATYYVDFTGGDDDNAGTSPETAWKTIGQVNGTAFAPGDVVLFKRGETWSSTTLEIDSNQVTYAAYGQGIVKPHIIALGTPGSYDEAILISGDDNDISGLKLSNGHESCVQILPGATWNAVHDNEMTNCGTGVMIGGSGTVAAANYVHDLKLIVNTQCEPGTPCAGDDYGAVCFWVDRGDAGVSDIEIIWNTGINCRAPSHDFGMDGGFVEFYGSVPSLAFTDTVHVAYNWSELTEGFSEFHGDVRNVTFHHNAIMNDTTERPDWGATLCMHGPGVGLSYTNIKFENNTFFKDSQGGWRVFACWGGTTFPLTVRNNIFEANVQISNIPPAVHTHNLYYVHDEVSGSGVGYALSTEETVGDPLFVDSGSLNFHLTAGSPAVNTGANLGYPHDIEGTPVPQGGTPDRGAFEFVPAGGAPQQPGQR